MLPFLKPKYQTGLIVETRKSDGDKERTNQSDADDGLKMAAEDLIRAVHSKDGASVASALRAAFEILDAEPHEEGPHTNDDESDSE